MLATIINLPEEWTARLRSTASPENADGTDQVNEPDTEWDCGEEREPKEFKLEKLQQLLSYGASPRASIYLALASKAYAFIKRRGYVIPEDVRAICHDVLRHRMGLTYEAEAENIKSEDIITGILNTVEVP